MRSCLTNGRDIFWRAVIKDYRKLDGVMKHWVAAAN